MTALSVTGLVAGWNAAPVIRGAGFDVSAGEIVAVLGGNGSGKSSLCWAVAGLLKPSAGSVTMGGRDVTGRSPARLAGLGLRFLPQTRRIFASMSVRENLEAVELGAGRLDLAAIRGRRVAWLERFPALGDRLDLPAASLSGGEQQLLALGRVLSTGPRVLLLDEPTAGLSPALVTMCDTLFREVSAGGVAILLVEQNVLFARRLADRVLHMEGGKLAPDTGSAETVPVEPAPGDPVPVQQAPTPEGRT